MRFTSNPVAAVLSRLRPRARQVAAWLRGAGAWLRSRTAVGGARGRRADGQGLVWAGLAGIAACGAVLLVWASAPDPAPPGRSGRAAPAATNGPARVAAAGSPPAEPAKPADLRIVPQGVDLGPYRVRPPFIILDGVTFGPEQARPTRLAGLVAPAATAVCFDRAGQLWACGLQARAALSRLISKREVECTPSGGPGRDVVEATCRIDDVDLGRALLDQGFARAAAADGPFAKPEAAARKAETGLWNGDWRLR